MNFSLTITNVAQTDLGAYSCVAINLGGMAESNVTLTFDDPSTWYDGSAEEQQMAILIGALAGGVFFLLVLVIVLCCCCRCV